MILRPLTSQTTSGRIRVGGMRRRMFEFARVKLVRSACRTIVPVRIHRVNEPDLPRARPMLDVLLSLNGSLNGVMPFIVDETFETVVLGKTLGETFPMLVGKLRQRAGHTDIKRAIAPVGHQIDPAACHGAI